jgi:hypothetical protein
MQRTCPLGLLLKMVLMLISLSDSKGSFTILAALVGIFWLEIISILSLNMMKGMFIRPEKEKGKKERKRKANRIDINLV